jgi:tight adherence protein B
MIGYLLALSCAATVFFLILTYMPVSSKDIVKARVAKYFAAKGIDDIQEQVIKEKIEKTKQNKSKKGKIVSKEFAEYLAMSGIKLNPSEFIYAWAGATFIPVVLILLLGGNTITASGIAIFGFMIPPFWVQKERKKRQQEFNKQLGESLVIMSNCIKAGFSFLQAMESIAKEMPAPISTEFAKTIREMHYGVSQKDALNHMVDRVKNKDLDLLVSAILTSAQVGGNLSDILEIIANTLRDRIRIKQEVRVLTAQGRVSGIVIGLLPVFILLALMVINPEYVELFFTTKSGKIMLAVSAVMEAIGFAIINKIVDIEY